jgi:ubiquinone/menaquinone biosynthesis C-methylase UbiE
MLKKRMDDFKSWIEDYNQITKSYCRKYVASKGYKNIVDCGCGVATEYYGYKHDCYNIEYTGLDSCEYLINFNRANGINMIKAELEVHLPIDSNSFECVYCRGVIEHLSYYENAINEFIRIGKKEVIIGWFLKPGSQPLYEEELPGSLRSKPPINIGEDQINYWEEEDLYHNVYAIDKMEKFILSNPKVEKIIWHDLTEKEGVLHIILKEVL